MKTIYILKGTKSKIVNNSFTHYVVAELLINDVEINFININTLKQNSYKSITTFRKIDNVKTRIKVFYTLYQHLLKIKENMLAS